MHIKRVEEYSFSHGQHRELNTGKFLPLQPHQFGRPLTHEEMDYNMRYMEQTLGGYKIFGSNQDTTLSIDDLDKSLVLHKITPADADYNTYITGGYFSDGDFVWLPACCGDISSGDSCDILVQYTNPGQASSGQNDVSLNIYVSGLNGAPEFTIDGSVVTPDSINGNQYIFDGFGAGTYSVSVTDLGITEYICKGDVIITVTEEDPVFTCQLANFQVADGQTGAQVSATVDLGVLLSFDPINYVEGNTTYTSVIQIPAGYQDAGTNITSCTDGATGTTTLPVFTCVDVNFQVSAGETGAQVSASVTSGTLISVSPATYTEGVATYTATIQIPAGYQDAGTNITSCTDDATGTTAPPVFTCQLANLQVADGETGAVVSATVDLGTLISVSPTNYVEGNTMYASVIEIPAGYQDAGTNITSCANTATGTTTLPVFTCGDANLQVADGETGAVVSATVDLGTLISVSPTNYVEGNTMYTSVIEIPAGYQDTGTNITSCANTATGTTTPTFTCGDANFQVADGETGAAVSATVDLGTLISVSPANYTEGTATYTATIEIPAGYQDAGTNITSCTDDAVGTTPIANAFLFHGGNGQNQEFPIVEDITDPTLTGDDFTCSTDPNDPLFDTDFETAMRHLLDNRDGNVPNIPVFTELDINDINTTELPNGIEFGVTSNFKPARFYFIVNTDGISLDLSTANAFSDPANGIAVSWTNYRDFTTADGTNWRIYRTESAPSELGQLYDCEIT